ncbi:MAG: HAD hydrolase-like protein [Bacteroidota bacterium]
MSSVLLFDIDGTLLQSHGVGRRSIEAALAEILGEPFDTSAIPFSGKTDPQIFREILDAATEAGFDVGEVEVTAARFGALYHERMERNLPAAHVEALPGAVDLVHRLGAEGVALGLLTGNLQPLGYAKIARLGLGPAEFPFGSFGSDASNRNDLPAIAAERASVYLGRSVAGEDLVVIGDTPRDIACARAAGATAVAVATGHYGVDDLTEADVVLETLEAFDLEALPVAR